MSAQVILLLVEIVDAGIAFSLALPLTNSVRFAAKTGWCMLVVSLFWLFPSSPYTCKSNSEIARFIELFSVILVLWLLNRLVSGLTSLGSNCEQWSTESPGLLSRSVLGMINELQTHPNLQSPV